MPAAHVVDANLRHSELAKETVCECVTLVAWGNAQGFEKEYIVRSKPFVTFCLFVHIVLLTKIVLVCS
jgi:hypothetical protein